MLQFPDVYWSRKATRRNDFYCTIGNFLFFSVYLLLAVIHINNCTSRHDKAIEKYLAHICCNASLRSIFNCPYCRMSDASRNRLLYPSCSLIRTLQRLEKNYLLLELKISMLLTQRKAIVHLQRRNKRYLTSGITYFDHTALIVSSCVFKNPSVYCILLLKEYDPNYHLCPVWILLFINRISTLLSMFVRMENRMVDSLPWSMNSWINYINLLSCIKSSIIRLIEMNCSCYLFSSLSNLKTKSWFERVSVRVCLCGTGRPLHLQYSQLPILQFVRQLACSSFYLYVYMSISKAVGTSTPLFFHLPPPTPQYLPFKFLKLPNTT